MKIGIIGAMEEEVTFIRETLRDRKTKTVARSEFHYGTIEGKEIVLLRSGIGKVNAAIGTTVLIHEFEPDYIINTGVAGGLNENLRVGDVVISTEVRYHDVDATVFGYEFGQVPQMPPAYKADRHLMEIAKNAAENVGIRSELGLIVSGDSFVGKKEQVETIKKQFKNPFCTEMEAGAIAQVCYQIAVPFVIIRALSDIAGQEAKVTYEEFVKTAAVQSAKHVIEIVKNLTR